MSACARQGRRGRNTQPSAPHTGTFITNLYFIQHLDPVKVHSLLTSSRVSSLLPAFIFASANKWEENTTIWSTVLSLILYPISSTSKEHSMTEGSRLMQLDTYAKARSEFASSQSSCLERQGAALALHVNTLYMLASGPPAFLL